MNEVKGFGPFPVESYDDVKDLREDTSEQTVTKQRRVLLSVDEVLGGGYVHKFKFDGV